MARGKVIKRSFQIRGRRYPIYVSPDAQLKYAKMGSRGFDNDLISIAQAFLRDDAVVWDIGANVGVFTFASSLVAAQGTVLAVEADIWLAGVLKRTRSLECYVGKDIRILPLAVSDRSGVASFSIAKRGRASNALSSIQGRSQMGGVRETCFVPTLRLDDLLKSSPPPSFVKIDVEGAESLLIAGASCLIQQNRPVFYVEVGAETGVDIIRRFTSEGYIPVGIDGKELVNELRGNIFSFQKK